MCLFLLSNCFGPNWVDNVESYMNSYADKRVFYWIWQLLTSKIIRKLYTKFSQLIWLFFTSILLCCKNSHSYACFKATVLSWAKYNEVTQNYQRNYNHPGIFVITFVFRSCLSCCSFLSDNHSNRYLFYGGIAINISRSEKVHFDVNQDIHLDDKILLGELVGVVYHYHLEYMYFLILQWDDNCSQTHAL